eukprot:CAMPEP_0115676504 /NCGR_PEP_ID=MMETSP0272-20121206/54728_1 /TAXON_ID=71861 /ORGANISM="Scrippsiella trochoidea, Strain CCMP3099" /LENGTH=275 /DNA_ID=CAMNT_0003115561 /DNA_START=53 /DNA_END=880 /DNA_ORIENTATION=+
MSSRWGCGTNCNKLIAATLATSAAAITTATANAFLRLVHWWSGRHRLHGAGRRVPLPPATPWTAGVLRQRPGPASCCSLALQDRDPLRGFHDGDAVTCGLVVPHLHDRAVVQLLDADAEVPGHALLRVVMHDSGGMHRRLHLDAAANLILACGPDMLDVEVHTHAENLVPLGPRLDDLRDLALVLALDDLHRVTWHDMHRPFNRLVGPVVDTDASLATFEPEPSGHFAASIRLRPRRRREGASCAEGHARELGPVRRVLVDESVHEGSRCDPIAC